MEIVKTLQRHRNYTPNSRLYREVSGAPGRMFDSYLERLSVTETSYINSLASQLTGSTNKILPATLPEPWFETR
jgi:hypothetical protein